MSAVIRRGISVRGRRYARRGSLRHAAPPSARPRRRGGVCGRVGGRGNLWAVDLRKCGLGELSFFDWSDQNTAPRPAQSPGLATRQTFGALGRRRAARSLPPSSRRASVRRRRGSRPTIDSIPATRGSVAADPLSSVALHANDRAPCPESLRVLRPWWNRRAATGQRQAP